MTVVDFPAKTFKCEGCRDGARIPKHLVPAGRVNDIGAPIYVCGDCSPDAPKAPVGPPPFAVNTTARTGYGTTVQIVHVLPHGHEADGDAIIGVLCYGNGSREICSWQRDGRFRKDRVSRLDLQATPVSAAWPHHLPQYEGVPFREVEDVGGNI